MNQSAKFYYFNDLKYPIFVSNETTKITKYTFQENGELWENKSIKQFYQNIDPTKEYNIIDIGAQSGLYSLYAKYLPNSTFYSFEPFPETFKLLNDNISLNGITNVKTFDYAISDKTGTAILNTCISHNGLHTLGQNVKRFKDIKSIECKTITLDDFFYKNDIPVNFIKIDTEGFEYFILKGGINTIKKYKPIIQLEWSEINMSQCNITINMMENLLQEINYKKMSFVEEEMLICSNE